MYCSTQRIRPGLIGVGLCICAIERTGVTEIGAKSKIVIPLFYKGHDTGKYFEMDLLIENEIIFEAKPVDIMHPVYEAQIISYLKLADKRLGYLVNFNVVLPKNGFKRFVNNF